MKLKDKKDSKESYFPSSARPIVKQSTIINIGSIKGGKDRNISLTKGEKLPECVDEKFYSSLRSQGVIE